MARNGSGTYVLPEAAFVPNTAISSTAVNSDLSDIADALTGSLARDGQGGMTAVLPLANTGFTYLTDPNTGMRRTAADTQAISAGGVDIATFTSTTATVTGTFNVAGTYQLNGVALLPLATANIADNSVTYAKIQEAAASRLIGNPTAGATEVSEISLGAGLEFSGTSIKGISVVPTVQRLFSGSGTYTTPANVKWIRIRLLGGGGGGGGGNNSSTAAAGGSTTFSGGTLTAGGGGGGGASAGGAGGSPTNGNVLSISGGAGQGSNGSTLGSGGFGGNSYLGGAGGGGQAANGGGNAGATNSGGGGGGGAFSGAPAAGGGSGSYIEHIIGAPAATYTYAVGAGGTGTAGSGGGGTGGNGGSGIIIVEEYY
jgi:hypothetical protein